MYNRIIVMGRLTIDPELRHTPSNIPLTSFRVAVNRPFVNKNGERPTDFFNVVAWRSQAEFICKYFAKGNCILIDGRMENRDYIDKNGIKQYISEIIVENASFTGESRSTSPYGNDTRGRSDSLADPLSKSAQVADTSFDNLNPGSFEEIDDDGDLPF